MTLSEGQAWIWSSNIDSDPSNYKLVKSQNEDEFYIDVSIHPLGF